MASGSEVRIRILPDASQFMARLRGQVTEAQRRAGKVRVGLDANYEQFAATMRARMAAIRPSIRVDVDQRHLSNVLRTVSRAFAGIGGGAGGGGAGRLLGGMASMATRAAGAVGSAMAKAASGLANFAAQAGQKVADMASRIGDALGQIGQKIGSLGKAAGPVGAAVSAAIGPLMMFGMVVGGLSLVPLIGQLTQAMGVFALLPAVIYGAIGAFAALGIGSMGVGDALSALSQDEQEVATAAEDMQRRVQAAAEAVQDAQRGVADAQREAKDAAEDLSRAYKDQRRELRDLNEDMHDAELATEGSAIAVARARQRLAEVKRARSMGKASALDVQEADLGLRQAQSRYRQQKNSTKDKREDIADANRKGVSGSDRVQNAQQRLADAQYGQIRAARSLRDALYEQSRAMRDAAGGASELEKALAKLSPNAQDFVRKIATLKGAWGELRNTVQDNLFAGLGDSVVNLAEKYLPMLERGLGRIASVFNNAFKDIMGAMSSDRVTGQWKNILDNTAKGLDGIMGGVRELGRAFTTIASVGSDFFPGLGQGFENTMTRFANWIDEIADNGKLAKFIQNAIDKFKELWRIGGLIFGVIGAIFRGSNESGEGMLSSITKTLTKWKEFLDTEEGQEAVKTFFEDVVKIAKIFAKVVEGVALAFGYLIKVGGFLAPVFGPAFDILNASTRLSMETFGGLIKIVEGLIDIFEGTFRVIGNIIRAAFALATGDMDGFGEAVNGFIDGAKKAWEGLGKVFGGLLDILKAPIHFLGRTLRAFAELPFISKLPGTGGLKTVGKTLENLNTGGQVRADAGRREDGLLYGPGGDRQDLIVGINPATGLPTAMVSPNEMVVNARSTEKWGWLLDLINRDSSRLNRLPHLETGGRPDGKTPYDKLGGTAWNQQWEHYFLNYSERGEQYKGLTRYGDLTGDATPAEQKEERENRAKWRQHDEDFQRWLDESGNRKAYSTGGLPKGVTMESIAAVERNKNANEAQIKREEEAKRAEKAAREKEKREDAAEKKKMGDLHAKRWEAYFDGRDGFETHGLNANREKFFARNKDIHERYLDGYFPPGDPMYDGVNWNDPSTYPAKPDAPASNDSPSAPIDLGPSSSTPSTTDPLTQGATGTSEAYGLAPGTNTGGYGSGGEGIFPQWVLDMGREHNVKPSTYPGHQEGEGDGPGYQPNPEGKNRGIDWVGSIDDMQRFADWLMSIAASTTGLEQVIWQNPNTGAKSGWAGRSDVTDGPYYDYPQGYPEHQNHVHTRWASSPGSATTTEFGDPGTDTPTQSDGSPSDLTNDEIANSTPTDPTSEDTPQSWSEIAGNFAKDFTQGQVSDALGVFGINDSIPGGVQAWDLYEKSQGRPGLSGVLGGVLGDKGQPTDDEAVDEAVDDPTVSVPRADETATDSTDKAEKPDLSGAAQTPSADLAMTGPADAEGVAITVGREQEKRAVAKAFVDNGHADWTTGDQWLNTLWLGTRESGWNPTIGYSGPVNSDAYGIFQFLSCVTLDTEILTRRGWLKYCDVQPGDETIGYNPATGMNEWTPIEAVMVDERPIHEFYTIGNSRWQATVTPDHRWWSERDEMVPAIEPGACPECGATDGKRGPLDTARKMRAHRARVHGVAPRAKEFQGRGQFVLTRDLNSSDDLILSAPAESGPGLDISASEAELLGWIAGDGSIFPAGTNGRGLQMKLYQAKLDRVAEIRALLASIGAPHTESVRGRGEGKHRPNLDEHAWYFHAEYAHDLLRRARFEDGWESMVLAMTDVQRKAWLNGMIAAEGTAVPSGDGEVMRIPQNDGPIQDAIILAAYLQGYRPTARRREGNDHFAMVTLARPRQHGSTIDTLDTSVGGKWCVKTALGTWTMRQNGQVMVTGNSTWATVGETKSDDPYVQGRAAMKYIANRYTDPVGAFTNGWMKQYDANGNHWYDTGGWLMPGWNFNGLKDPEPVLTTPQWNLASRAIQVAQDVATNAANAAAPGSGAAASVGLDSMRLFNDGIAQGVSVAQGIRANALRQMHQIANTGRRPAPAEAVRPIENHFHGRDWQEALERQRVSNAQARAYAGGIIG